MFIIGHPITLLAFHPKFGIAFPFSLRLPHGKKSRRPCRSTGTPCMVSMQNRLIHCLSKNTKRAQLDDNPVTDPVLVAPSHRQKLPPAVEAKKMRAVFSAKQIINPDLHRQKKLITVRADRTPYIQRRRPTWERSPFPPTLYLPSSSSSFTPCPLARLSLVSPFQFTLDSSAQRSSPSKH